MSESLHINPILCTGHGLCAELFPEHVWLDDWGYPVIDHGPIPPELMEHAKRAVAACPAVALRLLRDRHEREREAAQRNRRQRSGLSSRRQRRTGHW